MLSEDYNDRVSQQIEQYRVVENIHDLPEIFHYWSNKYLRPRLNEVLSADSIPQFYANAIARALGGSGSGRVVSLGSGDCSVEVAVAKELQRLGRGDLRLDCVELSPVLAGRAEELIRRENLTGTLRVVVQDLSRWSPPGGQVDAVMANHSLHHMVELEMIFDAVAQGLRPGGLFVSNDMIGRNGHMRWPEAKLWIDHLWPMLPDRLKYNHQLQRLERDFLDWDCSGEGFEGIRAQDILPLLVERFEFEVFLAYGGIVDVFTDRGFGHNFDVNEPRDRQLIDFLNFLNDRLIDLGEIKPTAMFAEMRPKSTARTANTRIYRRWTPAFCVRAPA